MKSTMHRFVKSIGRVIMAVIRPLVYASLPLVARVMSKAVRGNDAFGSRIGMARDFCGTS